MSAVAASYSKKQVSSPGMAIAFTNQHALEQFAERSVRQLNFGCGRSGGEDAILPRERGSQPCLKECRLPDSRVALKETASRRSSRKASSSSRPMILDTTTQAPF